LPEKDLKFCFCLKKSLKAGQVRFRLFYNTPNISLTCFCFFFFPLQYVLEFNLREGESRDMLSLMPKVKNAIQKAQRKTGKVKVKDSPSSAASTPSLIPRTSSVDSMASDSPDELEVLDWSDSFDEDKKDEESHSSKKEEKLERTPKDKRGHRRTRSSASNHSAASAPVTPDPVEALASDLKRNHHRSDKDTQRTKKHKNKEKKKQRDEKRDEKRAGHVM